MEAMRRFPGGVWPVMLTPYTPDDRVDIQALENLTCWYIDKGVSGLFAVCQTSEMFFLTMEERELVARTVVKATAGRVPVIASGHVSDSEEDQAEELNAIAGTGVDAVILITNRLATKDEGDDLWLERLHRLLRCIRPDIPLGFYECPYPYKRLLMPEVLREVIQLDRFQFLKDTCCDYQQILDKLNCVDRTPLKLYNANTTTLLATLRAGGAGYSGIMANFHPELYVWLCNNPWHEKAEALQEFLTLASLIERQVYPVNAKYALRELGLGMEIIARNRDHKLLNSTAKDEVRQLMSASKRVWNWLNE